MKKNKLCKNLDLVKDSINLNTIIFLISIFLILFIIFIYFYHKKIEYFQVELSDLINIENDLEKQRKKEDDETEKEFKKYANINKIELDKYLYPTNEKETKVNLNNENTDYKKNLLKFYENEKKNEEIIKIKLEEEKKKKYENIKKSNIYSFDDYQKFMLKNFKSVDGNRNFYKIGLNKLELLKEDCFEKCDSRECIKMDELQKNLDKCLKCNNQKNKCFKKSIIGGVCDDCSGDTKKIDCFDIKNFGCTNPINIDYNRGIDPYFISVNDNNVNSPYNKKCVFCWNISNEI
jgi:hypothetical protein